MKISREYLEGFKDGHDHGYAAGYEAARKEIEELHTEHVESCLNCPYINVCADANTVKSELCGLLQEA